MNSLWISGMANPSDETYPEDETERRREAALKVMLATPHKPHKPKGGDGTKRAKSDS
jgi:hypothetical protein